MPQYDSNILQLFADGLYARAEWIRLRCCLWGALIGMLFIGTPVVLLVNVVGRQAVIDQHQGAGSGADHPVQGAVAVTAKGSILVAFLTLLGGAIGASYGQRRALELRLQAQLTLCQMRIESNTRQPRATGP